MKPQLLGARPTFALVDRFGFFGPHLATALGESGFAPIIACTAPADLRAAGRSPQEALTAAQPGGPAWGAEAERIGAADEARTFVAAGFTRLSIEPSVYLVHRADDLSPEELAAASEALVEDGVFPADWLDLYPERTLPHADGLTFSTETLQRAAVKLGWALAYTAEIIEDAAAAGCEVELSLREMQQPTTALEHWLAARELRRRGIRCVAIAPCLRGWWEVLTEFDGDPGELAATLSQHHCIAEEGGHQVTLTDLEAREGVLPLVGRELGDRLSVRLGTLPTQLVFRAIAQHEPGLFRAFLPLAQERFSLARTDRISLTEDEVRCLPDVPDDRLVETFFGDPRGRQLIASTAPSLWHDGVLPSGECLRARIEAFASAHGASLEAALRASISRFVKGLRPDAGAL